MLMTAWNIYLGYKLLTTVFYGSWHDADYVKRTLVEHDHYDRRIKVRKSK